MTPEQVEKLTGIGNEWEGYGKHRIYFDDLPGRLGLDVSYYKTGNVSGATLDGELISNSECRRILSRMAGAKFFYDITGGTFEVQYGSLAEDEKQRIIHSVKTEGGIL